MIPAQFDYVRPGSLDEALRILSDREGEAKLLSGGYSLIPLIKLRLAQPALLVDMQAITGLDGIVGDRRLPGDRGPRDPSPDRRGAGRRRASTRASPTSPGGIGDPQVRNWGTIGGSVAHADPGVGLAGGSCSRSTRPIVCRGPNGNPRDPGPRLLPRHVHHGDRADRGPDRGPDPRRGAGHGRRLHEARAHRSATSRRPGSRPASGWTRTARSASAGIGVTGVSAVAVRGDRRRGGRSSGKRPSRRGVPRGRCGRRGREPAGLRRPGSRRVQAGDGRRAHRPVPPSRHRARALVQRVGDDDDAAHRTHRQRRGPRGRRRAPPPARPPPPRRVRAHRHPRRVRHQQLRRVHRPRRRPEREVVHDARRPGRRAPRSRRSRAWPTGPRSTRSSRRSGTSTASSAASARRG